MFRAIRFEFLHKEKIVLCTPKMIIGKPVLENYIQLLQQGDLYLGNVSIPLSDSKNSYLVMYDSYRSMRGRVPNQTTNRQEDFDIKGIDPKALAAYLINQKAVVV